MESLISTQKAGKNTLAEWPVTDSARYPYHVSRKGREAWEDPRRDGPTSLKPEQTKQSKP